jgi:hypothetical protein
VNTYTFRLRFTVSHAPAFLHDGESLELALSGLPGPCILVPFYGGLVRNAKEFVLKASGFPTEERAREAGERTRVALRITFTDLRVGLSVGDRPSTLSFGKIVHDQASESGYELRGDAHGLLVYPDEPPVCFMSMQGSLVVTSPLDTFTEQFAKTFEKSSSATDSVTLGLELYGLSYFGRRTSGTDSVSDVRAAGLDSLARQPCAPQRASRLRRNACQPPAGDRLTARRRTGPRGR